MIFRNNSILNFQRTKYIIQDFITNSSKNMLEFIPALKQQGFLLGDTVKK